MKLSLYLKYLLFIILFVSSGSLKAQSVQNRASQEELPNPFQVVKKYIEQNNYITPIFELKSREDKYLASRRWKSAYLTMMSYMQGYVGNYDEAYKYENRLIEATPSYERVRK